MSGTYKVRLQIANDLGCTIRMSPYMNIVGESYGPSTKDGSNEEGFWGTELSHSITLKKKEKHTETFDVPNGCVLKFWLLEVNLVDVTGTEEVFYRTQEVVKGQGLGQLLGLGCSIDDCKIKLSSWVPDAVKRGRAIGADDDMFD